MSKMKLIMAALAAMIVVGAVASSAASATTAGWMVNGATLASGATKALANTAKVEEAGILEGVNFKITCTGETLNGASPILTAPAKGSATSLEFTGCTGEEPCSIEGTTISTVPITAEATLDGALAVKATFAPKTKNTFATIKFIGATCALFGVQPVTGTQEVLAKEGQDERVGQLIKAVGSTLKVGSSAATLLGSAVLQLASGEPWSFL